MLKAAYFGHVRRSHNKDITPRERTNRVRLRPSREEKKCKIEKNPKKGVFGLFWQLFSPKIFRGGSAPAPPARPAGRGPNSHHCHRSFPAFSLVVVAAARVIPGRKNIIAPIDRSQRALSDSADRSQFFVKSEFWGTAFRGGGAWVRAPIACVRCNSQSPPAWPFSSLSL